MRATADPHESRLRPVPGVVGAKSGYGHGMGLFERLRTGLRRDTASRVGRRPPTTVTTGTAPADDQRENALRQKLVHDPNDAASFAALAELVRRRAHETAPSDPLIAPHGQDRQREANIAVWALAEELAGNPKGWYPLIELARLSLHDDHEAALRRLASACQRDTTGHAVAEGVRMLREANLPAEALGLGVGHWDPKHHIPEAGRHVVLAALDAGRPAEARRHLNALSEVGGHHAGAAKEIRARLEPLVAAAEEMAKTAYTTQTGTVPAVVDSRRSSAPFATSPGGTGTMPAIPPQGPAPGQPRN